MARLRLNEQDIWPLQERLRESPDDVDALVELGALRFEPGHDDGAAVELLSRALALDPKNVDARFWLAKTAYHDRSDYQRAKRLLDEALDIDPNRADCLSLLYSVRQDLGEEEPTRDAALLQRAIERAPQWPTLRYDYARWLLAQRRWAEAEEEARRGLMGMNADLGGPAGSYYDEAVSGVASPALAHRLQELLGEITRLRRRGSEQG